MALKDQVKKHLREWYSLAADRTGEMAKISVRMYDKYGISREIERQLSELGSYVYHAQAEGRCDFADDEVFQAAIDRVRDLERDLSAKIDEIEIIRQQRQQRAAGAGDAERDTPGPAEPDGMDAREAEVAQDAADAEDAEDAAGAQGDPPPLLVADTGELDGRRGTRGRAGE